MKRITLALLFALTVLPSMAQQVFTHTYVQRDGVELKMDIWYPETRRNDSVTVVYVFGGGFVNGSRNDSVAMAACRTLTKKGFLAVSIDYRLGLQRGYTDFDTVNMRNSFDIFLRSADWAAADLSEAIKYLCEHAGPLSMRTDRMVLTGASAGAIAVLQNDYARANGMDAAKELPLGWKPLAVISYAGAVISNEKPRYATPPAPTCFLHGTIDRIVSYNKFPPVPFLQKAMWGSNKLAPLFRKNNFPYWMLSFKDLGHEVNHFLPQTIEEFSAFVDVALANRRTFYDATLRDEALNPGKWSKKNVFQLYGI
ncbi:MAG: alpha/beta hydrolase [Bacteroidales bacterium]|nr:alpha/beta hydrolase [Bacteroidales bacterium]